MDDTIISGINSIKGAIQTLAPEQVRLIECEVTKEPPELELRACNDEKLIIPRSLIVVPRELTDRTVPCYIETETDYVGIHSYDSSEVPEHKYRQTWICLHDGLRVGEHVLVFALRGGKKYLVIGRVPSDLESLAQHHEDCPGCDAKLPERELQDWMIMGGEPDARVAD